MKIVLIVLLAIILVPKVLDALRLIDAFQKPYSKYLEDKVSESMEKKSSYEDQPRDIQRWTKWFGLGSEAFEILVVVGLLIFLIIKQW